MKIVCQFVMHFSQVLLVWNVGEWTLLKDLVLVKIPAKTKGKEISWQSFVVLFGWTLIGWFKAIDITNDGSFQELSFSSELGKPLQIEDERVYFSMMEDSDPFQEGFPSLPEKLPQFFIIEALAVQHKNQFKLGSLCQEVQ